MTEKIEITCSTMPAAAVKELLESDAEIAAAGIVFEARKAVDDFLPSEPEVLVAIIGGSTALLGVLLGGLLKVVASTKTRNVVIQGRSGRRVEIPADTPAEKLDEYVAKAKDLDLDRIDF